MTLEEELHLVRGERDSLAAAIKAGDQIAAQLELERERDEARAERGSGAPGTFARGMAGVIQERDNLRRMCAALIPAVCDLIAAHDSERDSAVRIQEYLRSEAAFARHCQRNDEARALLIGLFNGNPFSRETLGAIAWIAWRAEDNPTAFDSIPVDMQEQFCRAGDAVARAIGGRS